MKNKVIKTKIKSNEIINKKVVSGRNREIKNFLTVANENREEFEVFLKSKSCEINTKFIELEPGLSLFNCYVGFSKIPIKQIIYPNGLLKDFQIHFEKKLIASREFNAERDFALFVISYLNPQKVKKQVAGEYLNKIKEHKGGRPISKETKTILNWKKQNPSLTPQRMAVEITDKDKKTWIQEKLKRGMPRTEAEKEANLKFNTDYKEDKRIKIAKAIQHHKTKQTKQKSIENYFNDTENYLSVFRVGNNYFIIDSHGDEIAQS